MATTAAPIGVAAGSPNWGQVCRELDRFGPTGEVPELRCGTGLWTLEAHAPRGRGNRRRRLAGGVGDRPRQAGESRARDSRSLRQADLFDWRSKRAYDAVFFRLLALARTARTLRRFLRARPVRAPSGRARLLLGLFSRRDPGREGAPRAATRSPGGSTTGGSSGSSRSSTIPPTWDGASPCARRKHLLYGFAEPSP